MSRICVAIFCQLDRVKTKEYNISHLLALHPVETILAKPATIFGRIKGFEGRARTFWGGSCLRYYTYR